MECKSFAVGSLTKGRLYIHWHEEDGHPDVLRMAELVSSTGDTVFSAEDVDIRDCGEGKPYAHI